eukprot:scaffold22535_cov121-Isochrysis_galbana.AAC.1
MPPRPEGRRRPHRTRPPRWENGRIASRLQPRQRQTAGGAPPTRRRAAAASAGCDALPPAQSCLAGPFRPGRTQLARRPAADGCIGRACCDTVRPTRTVCGRTCDATPPRHAHTGARSGTARRTRRSQPQTACRWPQSWGSRPSEGGGRCSRGECSRGRRYTLAAASASSCPSSACSRAQPSRQRHTLAARRQAPPPSDALAGCIECIGQGKAIF